MSTRATYCIDGHFFYIHHDGYYAGAAFYFRNMIDAENKLDPEYSYRTAYNGGYAEQFLRANSGAEFTDSHELHADTEYRYDVFIKDGEYMVTATELDWERDSNGNKNVKRIVTLPLDQFINENIDPEWYSDIDVTVKVYRYKFSKYARVESLVTYDNLKAILAEKESLASTWRKNGNDSGANWDSLQEEICNVYDVMNKANDEG